MHFGSGSAGALELPWPVVVFTCAVAVALVSLRSSCGVRTGSLEKRFICLQGTAVLTGFSAVGGLGMRVLRQTGTDGRLAVTEAWSLDLVDGVTSGTVK